MREDRTPAGRASLAPRPLRPAAIISDGMRTSTLSGCALLAAATLTGCAAQAADVPVTGTRVLEPTLAPTSPIATSTRPASTTAVPSAPTPTPRAVGACLNDASFVDDLTIPDGSVFIPGEPFDKRWLVRNSGTCDWGPDHRLVPVGENRFGGPAEMALYPAKAGTSAEWQIDLVAPLQPGEYLGRWQARGPDGTPFGDEVFILIFVELPTATPSPIPTATP